MAFFKDFSSCHVNYGKLYISHIDIGLFPGDVQVWNYVLVDWNFVFFKHTNRS